MVCAAGGCARAESEARPSASATRARADARAPFPLLEHDPHIEPEDAGRDDRRRLGEPGQAAIAAGVRRDGVVVQDVERIEPELQLIRRSQPEDLLDTEIQ